MVCTITNEENILILTLGWDSFRPLSWKKKLTWLNALKGLILKVQGSFWEEAEKNLTVDKKRLS